MTRRAYLRLVAQAAFTALLLVVAEGALRIWAPYRLVGAGGRGSRNADRYGWGYAPGQTIELQDPDTGEVYLSEANSGGWRDLERGQKPAGRIRVLALGDSTTFGAIVREDEIWTRVLERQLRELGYDADVVNMSYSGWGTDQQLEALRLEGSDVGPDVVVLQWCTNDLGNNLQRDEKPFFYDLEPSGELVRRQATNLPDPPEPFLSRIVDRSEILKRVWYHGTGRTQLLGQRQSVGQDLVVNAAGVELLRANLGSESKKVEGDLWPRMDRPISKAEAEGIARRHGISPELLLRACERRWWSHYPLSLRRGPVEPDRLEWRMTRSLLREMARVARDLGAPLAIYSENEEGHYQWERYWFRIDPTPESRVNYLAPSEELRRIAVAEGIGWVEQTRVVERARNDPHANATGNAAIAGDVLDYLRARWPTAR